MVKTEVDMIDFIGLEGLRVFLPEIYQGIAENKNLFTHPRQPLQDNNPLLPKIKETLDSIFVKVEGSKEISRKICIELFPELQSVYGNIYFHDETSVIWRKQKRVCSKDNFDAYFLLGTPKGSVSHLDADEFLQKTTNENNVVQQLDTYYKENRYRKLLERISDRLDQLGEDQIKNLCQGLMKFGATIPAVHEGIFDLGSDHQITILVRALMLKLPNDIRFKWFRTFLENDPPLFTSIDQVLIDLPRGENMREIALFTEEQLGQLKEICVKEIEHQSKGDSFLNQKELKFILFRWKDWSQESPVRDNFLNTTFLDSGKCLDFIGQFVYDSRSQTAGDYLLKTEKRLDKKGLYQFQTPEWLTKFINDFTDEDLIKLSVKRRETYQTVKEILSQPSKKDPSETL
jgi:predicted KAP-like P-loop ATPase